MLCDCCQKVATPGLSRTWIMARRSEGGGRTPNPQVMSYVVSNFKQVTACLCEACYQREKAKFRHRASIDLALGAPLAANAALTYFKWDATYVALGFAIAAAIFLLRAIVIPFGDPGIVYLVDRAREKIFPQAQCENWVICHWTPEEFEKARQSGAIRGFGE